MNEYTIPHKNKLLTLKLAIILIIVVISFFGYKIWRIISVSEKAATSIVESVVLETEDHYPVSLPYINPNLDDIPIKLKNMTIIPSKYEKLRGSGFSNEYLPLNARLYMVQFKDQQNIEAYMETRPLGTYEKNTYVISANSQDLNDYTKNPNANFLDHYHPHYKIDPKLLRDYFELKINPSKKITIRYTQTALSQEVKSFIEALPAKIDKFDETSTTVTFSGISDRQQLFSISLSPLVLEVF